MSVVAVDVVARTMGAAAIIVNALMLGYQWRAWRRERPERTGP